MIPGTANACPVQFIIGECAYSTAIKLANYFLNHNNISLYRALIVSVKLYRSYASPPLVLNVKLITPLDDSLVIGMVIGLVCMVGSSPTLSKYTFSPKKLTYGLFRKFISEYRSARIVTSIYKLEHPASNNKPGFNPVDTDNVSGLYIPPSSTEIPSPQDFPYVIYIVVHFAVNVCGPAISMFMPLVTFVFP